MAFVVLDGIQCDGSALNDVEDSLVVSDNVESATLESRVAQLEMKFSLIDSLNEEKEKLRSDNSKLHNENAMQKMVIDDLMAKVASLEAEVVALKRCDDENGLTKLKTTNEGKICLPMDLVRHPRIKVSPMMQPPQANMLNKLAQGYLEILNIRGI